MELNACKHFLKKIYFNRFVDTGGQRNERRKWVHAVTGMHLLIFCVALNDFDKKCYEDDKTNRLHESLNIWTNCIKERWFNHIPKLLLFTKLDLFKEKIQYINLNVCFPDYKGLLNLKLIFIRKFSRRCIKIY